MKRNRLKNLVAAMVALCTLGFTAANAQVVTSLDSYNGSFIVDRFGTEDGRLVAYGWLVGSDGTRRSNVNVSGLGSWTGIGTGYGESGVESRSNMLSSGINTSSKGLDIHLGATSGNDRVGSGIDVRFGPTSGNDRVASGIDVQMGSTSANDRTTIDARMGATSGNDKTQLDARFGETRANDRTGIDLRFGPTSGNDRVASGPIDLNVGATSGNDRTQLDGRMGATSGNDRTQIDASLGATSDNDRTSIELSAGPTSGNDRVATGIDVQMGPTSGNDRVASGIDLSVGATSGNDRTTVASSSVVAVPVQVLGASCDAVSISIGGSEAVAITTVTEPEASRDELCSVSDVNRSGNNDAIARELNDLIGRGS